MLDSIAGQDLQPGRPPPRGDPSVDSQMILTARNRLRRALKLGYETVYDRFNRDDASLAGEGCTAFDAAQEDLFASLQLPAPSRSAKQRSKGKSVVSELDRQERVELAKLAFTRCGVDNLYTCFKPGLSESFLISYSREFLSLRQYAAVIGNGRDEVKVQGFIPTDDVYGDIHNISIPRGDTMGVYKDASGVCATERQYAIAQYQQNVQQSVRTQEKGRGMTLDAFGFMNLEQRMATSLPKFADYGQDITSDEIICLERLLLEFGQRDAPSPVTRPPLHRKRSQASDVETEDVDKRPRLQWRKKDERDDTGRFAAWSDDRVPPPGVPKPPAPVTGTHTVSVYRPPPVPRALVPPKKNFPKRNVVPDPPIAPKGHPASFVPGTTEQNVGAAWQPPGAKQSPLPNVEGDGTTAGESSNAPVKGKPWFSWQDDVVAP